jgi:tRNA pseudouridine(38-40) synthase
MQTFKLTLEYDGSRFSGWQEQINARTVQGELKQAVRDLFQADVEVQDAGRTDAGVHAVGQVAHLKLRDKATRLEPEEILRELNDRLPSSAPYSISPQRRRAFTRAMTLFPDRIFIKSQPARQPCRSATCGG